MTATVQANIQSDRLHSDVRGSAYRGAAALIVVMVCLISALPAAAKTRVGFSLGLDVAPRFCAPPPYVYAHPPAPVVIHHSRGHYEWIEEHVLTGYETRQERVWVNETRTQQREWDSVRRVWVNRTYIMPGHYRTELVEVPVYQTVQRQVWVEAQPHRVYRRAPLVVRPRVGLHLSVR